MSVRSNKQQKLHIKTMKYIRKHKQIIEESWFSDISIPNNPISNSLKGTELSIDISISDLSNSYKLNANNEYCKNRETSN